MNMWKQQLLVEKFDGNFCVNWIYSEQEGQMCVHQKRRREGSILWN